MMSPKIFIASALAALATAVTTAPAAAQEGESGRRPWRDYVRQGVEGEGGPRGEGAHRRRHRSPPEAGAPAQESQTPPPAAPDAGDAAPPAEAPAPVRRRPPRESTEGGPPAPPSAPAPPVGPPGSQSAGPALPTPGLGPRRPRDGQGAQPPVGDDGEARRRRPDGHRVDGPRGDAPRGDGPRGEEPRRQGPGGTRPDFRDPHPPMRHDAGGWRYDGHRDHAPTWREPRGYDEGYREAERPSLAYDGFFSRRSARMAGWAMGADYVICRDARAWGWRWMPYRPGGAMPHWVRLTPPPGRLLHAMGPPPRGMRLFLAGPDIVLLNRHGTVVDALVRRPRR